MTAHDVPVVSLLKQLIEIPSTSDDELAVGIFLEKHLQSLGYTSKSNRKTRICLTSHMDTVPPHIPSCDDQGPLAAQIEAVEELRRENKIDENGGDISFLFVVGEEKGGPGMLAANDLGLRWEAVIFGEPTEGKLGVGHKGHVVFELSATGVASHSGYPEQGSSANAALIVALSELLSAEWPSSDLLGPSTFHVGRMSGGVAYNVLAATSEALRAVRVASDLPGIKSQISDIVSKHEGVSLDVKFDYPETLLDHDVEGFAPYAAAFGTDIPRLQGQHKKYLYGPGSILNAHGKNEHIKVSELLESAQAYKKIVLHCLK
ncbi:putative peptidase [Acephala macrosclerotiorum]|nr:putative peptidase [Acephala macrosclerotiorum]